VLRLTAVRRLLLICTPLLTVLACDPSPPRSPACLAPPLGHGTAVARVGDVIISAEQIEQRVRAQGQNRHTFESVKGLRELVEDQVRFELLAQAALDRGLARDPDVIDAARKVMVRKLLQRDLDPSVFEDAMGDDALRAYYERHRESYLQLEKRRFAQIQLQPTEEGRAIAQSIIDRIQGKANTGELLAQQAQRFSMDVTTKSRGGDSPFATLDEIRDDFGLSFANAVFSHEPGTLVAGPVASTRGWHVVRVVARREALTRDFAEVREQIREKLLQGQRSTQFQKYLEDIERTYAVAIYDDKLQGLLNDWAGKGP
jgi:peptidyl-prolyl cis-trans isomerase C